MLRNTALTALLLLSADAATTALAPAGFPSLTAQASAADFTGKIKRIKIKKTRVGTGYKVVSRVESTDSAQAASADITLSDAETGAVLEELTIDDPIRARAYFSATLSEGSSTDLTTYKVYPQLAEDSDSEFVFDDEGYELDENGEAIAGGFKIRAKLSADGALQVSITNEDRGWDPDSIASMRVADAEGGPGWLSLDGIRHTFRADLREGFVFEDNIMMRAILFDGDGGVLDTFQQVASPPSGAEAAGLEQVSVKETRSGVAKLVTWTTTDGDAASLEVELLDQETGEAVLYTVDDTPILTERTYLSEDLEFDPGDVPEGYTYLCLIDVLDANGDIVGEQHEVELTMPSLEDGEAYAVAAVSFAGGSGSVGFLNTGDGYHVVGALWHEDASQAESFNLVFEEPFEGPAPLETEVNAGTVSKKEKWVQKGTGALPDAYEVTATLTAADGTVLESSTVSGSGTGTVYKDGGIVPGTIVSVGDKEVLLNIGF